MPRGVKFPVTDDEKRFEGSRLLVGSWIVLLAKGRVLLGEEGRCFNKGRLCRESIILKLIAS